MHMSGVCDSGSPVVEAVTRLALGEHGDELRDPGPRDDLLDGAVEALGNPSGSGRLELTHQALLGGAQLLTYLRVLGDHVEDVRGQRARRRYGGHASSGADIRTICR